MLKSQDVLVALAVLVLKDKQWRQSDIANLVNISVSEVNAAIKRLVLAKLMAPSVNEKKPEVLMNALKEFLVHGLKYVFPAEIGRVTRGKPTGYAAPVFQGEIVYNPNDVPVWPDAHGKVQGYSISPLYRSVASIANEELYSLLCIIDAIRIGKARERNLGIKLLEEKLDDYRAA